MIRPMDAIAVILGALLVVACGGPKGGQSASTRQAPDVPAQQAAPSTTAAAGAAVRAMPARLEPCVLLTKSAAAAAAGSPVKDGEARDSGQPLGQQFCAYTAASDTSSRIVQLSVVTDAGFGKELRDRNYTAKQLFTDSRVQAQTVPGVGEDAYMQGPHALHVLQRDVYFSISVTGGAIGRDEPPVTVETLTALARSVLAQLRQ